MIYALLKIKISVYFVTSAFSFILNIVSTNKQMYKDVFDLQEIKTVEQSFCVLTFPFL